MALASGTASAADYEPQQSAPNLAHSEIADIIIKNCTGSEKELEVEINNQQLSAEISLGKSIAGRKFETYSNPSNKLLGKPQQLQVLVDGEVAQTEDIVVQDSEFPDWFGYIIKYSGKSDDIEVIERIV